MTKKLEFSSVHLSTDNLEENYDDITIKMIFAIVQAVGFSNSFNNPVVYTFMNENFKKNIMAVLFCSSKSHEVTDKQESQHLRIKVGSLKCIHRKEGQRAQGQLCAENLEL